ncbi:MAG: GntR family transcriptional regulator [Pseudomonadales bacterium]
MAETRTGDTLAEQVLERIQAAIVAGALPPGSKISEPEFARSFGVSRGPLREAIRRLEARRLVEFVPHIGARVTSLTVEQLSDIYQVREGLEGMAARLAAERMEPGEVDALAALLERHAASPELSAGTGYFQPEYDSDFHYRIAHASRNEVLAQLLGQDLYHLVRMYRHRFSAYEGRPQRALEEHRRIVAAIRDGDGELAEILMRRHIAGARQNIVARYGQGQSDGN